MSIEKLTDEDRDELFEANYRVCSKALRIIDQLTAALEATTDEALKERVEYWREACQAAESRAEALQASRDVYAKLASAEALMARRMNVDGSNLRPREQLSAECNVNADIVTFLQAAGWVWDGLHRKWVKL